MNEKLVWIAFVVLALILGFVLWMQSDFTLGETEYPVGHWFLAESAFVNNHVLIKLKFPFVKEVGWWILDTGSTHHLVDKYYAQELYTTSNGRIQDVNKKGFTFGSANLPKASIVGKSIGKSASSTANPIIPLRNVGTLDIQQLASAMVKTPWTREQLDSKATHLHSSDIVGVIGYPLFRDFIVSIDFPRQQVWLANPKTQAKQTLRTHPPGASHQTPQVLRARMNQHKLLLLEMDVEGFKGPWSLDTGSNITVMSHKHPARGKGKALGDAQSAQLVNRKVQVQPKEFNIVFHSKNGGVQEKGKIHVPDQQFAKAIENLHGNVGVNLLQSHRLTLNYANKSITMD